MRCTLKPEWLFCTEPSRKSMAHPWNGSFCCLLSRTDQKKKNAKHVKSSLTVIVVDDLEILDRGLSDPAVEVEHVGLRIVVPHRRLVVKFNHAFCVLVLPSGQQWLMLLYWRQQKLEDDIMDIRLVTVVRTNLAIKKRAFTYISWANRHSLVVHVHSRNDNAHFSRSFES